MSLPRKRSKRSSLPKAEIGPTWRPCSLTSPPLQDSNQANHGQRTRPPRPTRQPASALWSPWASCFTRRPQRRHLRRQPWKKVGIVSHSSWLFPGPLCYGTREPIRCFSLIVASMARIILLEHDKGKESTKSTRVAHAEPHFPETPSLPSKYMVQAMPNHHSCA